MRRMRWMFHSVLILSLAPVSYAQTKPATTAPSTDLQLDGGRVRLTLPDGWERVGDVDAKGLAATFQRKDGPGLMAMTIDVQKETIPPDQARKIAKAIDEQLRTTAKTNGVDLTYGPKVEKDERFFLKVNTRMDVPDRGVVDETHLYRVMGLNLIYLNVTIDSDSEDEARAVRETA